MILKMGLAVFDGLVEGAGVRGRFRPVPGGPNKSTPFQGLSSPVNSCGYLEGITTASFKRRLALSAAATSLHRTSGFDVQMSRCSDPASSRNSLISRRN